MYFLEKYRRGIFNRYQRSKSLPKYVLEDLRFLINAFFLYIRNGFEHRVLGSFPHLPSKRSSLHRIATHLGYNLTNRLTPKASVLVYWEYLTFREEQHIVRQFHQSTGIPVINLNSIDISKRYVDKHFKAVFGYSTFVDPLTHQGPCVEKGDINALHDGRIIHAPIDTVDTTKVYQLVIDNVEDGKVVRDLRVPVFRDEIPLVFVKFRDVAVRFENSTVRTQVVDPENVFTKEELVNIRKFCQLIQLDYGELDIIRDRPTGKIYIVDVNNTPQSPPKNCTPADHKRSVAILAKAFERAFLNQNNQTTS